MGTQHSVSQRATSTTRCRLPSVSWTRTTSSTSHSMLMRCSSWRTVFRSSSCQLEPVPVSWLRTEQSCSQTCTALTHSPVLDWCCSTLCQLTSDNSVKIVNHKYGGEAGEVFGDAVTAAGNAHDLHECSESGGEGSG